jgi:two-component system sensor kinase FixL
MGIKSHRQAYDDGRRALRPARFFKEQPMAFEPNAGPRPWETDALFQALSATLTDGIVIIGPDGMIQICNAACAMLFGFSSTDVTGCNIGVLVPELHNAGHDGYRCDGGREVVGRRKDGETFSIVLSVGEGRRKEGRFFVCIIRDLSDLQTQTAARLSSDRLLAQIVHSSDSAIISKTLGGIITSWNASAERIFGYSAAEAIGRDTAMLFPPDLLPEEEKNMVQLRAGREVHPYETVRRHKDGHDLTVLLSVAPIRDGAGRVIGASKTARDITERKQAEFQTHKLQSELAHVARLSALGQMSAAIAHELNQPLTAITNYVKAAHRMLGSSDLSQKQIAGARDAMEKAAGQTLRAGTIIRSLREFIEKRDSDKTREDLNMLIKQAVSLGLVGSAASNVAVVLALAPDLAPVMVDKIQIQQVLVNLIRNSMEAMATVDTCRITITTAPEGQGQVSIVIRDTGPGLAPEVQQKLFQPFVTTKQQGMGIGLMICQSIIEAHGGAIRSLSDDLGGAAFHIRLPVKADDEPGAPAAP